MHRTFFGILKLCVIVALGGPFLPGCSRSGTETIRVDASEVLARYLVGTLLRGEETDSLLTIDGDRVSIRGSVLVSRAPEWGAALGELGADGLLDRDDIDLLLARSYEANPGLPADVHTLRAEMESTESFTFEMTGSMTPYRRRLHAPLEGVREALRSFAAGRGMRYPAGTTIVGEHFDAGRLVETTVMRRRRDGFWDFAAYDSTGRPTTSIEGEPDRLSVPSDCFGCHYGSRSFEPEKSFPDEALPGPHGARIIDVPARWRRPEVADRLDEHARRDDGVLGLYGTLWVSSLLADGAAESTADGDRELLRSIGF